MAVVPLPHPDSTVPGRSAPYWLVPVVGARSGPSDSNEVYMSTRRRLWCLVATTREGESA